MTASMRDDVAVTDVMLDDGRRIALRNAVRFDPSAFEVRCGDGQDVALVLPGRESREGVRRISRWMRTAIHVDGPVALCDLAIEAPRRETLGKRIALFPNPVVAGRIPEVRRDITHALVLLHGLPGRRPCQRIESRGVVQRDAAEISEIPGCSLRIHDELIGTPRPGEIGSIHKRPKRRRLAGSETCAGICATIAGPAASKHSEDHCNLFSWPPTFPRKQQGSNLWRRFVS